MPWTCCVGSDRFPSVLVDDDELASPDLVAHLHEATPGVLVTGDEILVVGS